MPQRRRVLVSTASPAKVEEIARELKQYDIVAAACAPLADDIEQATEQAARLLSMREEEVWNKAVFRESTTVYLAPRGGLAEFSPSMTRATEPLQDGTAVIIVSKLTVYMLPRDAEAEMRESKVMQQRGALHTHPIATAGGECVESSDMTSTRVVAAGELRVSGFSHAVEAYVDLSRRRDTGSSATVFGWDDVLVLVQSSCTYQELLPRGLKYSPRDVNVARWIMNEIWYKRRKVTNFINERSGSFTETIMFDDAHSVCEFVRTNRFFNNEVAARTGLRDVFMAVANNGAFFRAAHTRREVNYWLPGLNAGIPFVAKRDEIHEITFTAHDFGHFLLPDLVYTGNNSPNARRLYILYRMLSEATTMVFADMLFVETLRQSGFKYDYAKRCIHPLYLDTGLTPFDGDRRHFFEQVKRLLAANVAYCLLGDDSKYIELIEAHRGAPLPGGTCGSLERFKAKFMPFFVEDYRWTSANFACMSQHAPMYRRWWDLASPVVAAAGLAEMSDGVGLETVDQFMAAIGVRNDTSIAPADLIHRLFERVFDTRITPVLARPGAYELAPPEACLKHAFARYLTGQMVLFARFDFVPEAAAYRDKLVALFAQHAAEGFTPEKAETARSLYRLFLRILAARSLITPDDYENWAQICPLFEPVYVFYDENKEFYQELSEVQAEILDAGGEEVAVGPWSPLGRRLRVGLIVAAASVACAVLWKRRP